MIDYDNLSPVQQEALDTRYYACTSGPCDCCPLWRCDAVRRNENGYLDCYGYCVEHPDEAMRLFAQAASARIADTAEEHFAGANKTMESKEELSKMETTTKTDATSPADGAVIDCGTIGGWTITAPAATEKEENNVNLKDYTPKQLMAGGATEIYCQGIAKCDSCLLHEIDGGERPTHCASYAARYPDEVLKALGVELPEEITPAMNDVLRADYEELLEKQRLLMEEIDTKRVELDWLNKATETKTTPMTRAECLDRAKEVVTGQREQDYGKPEDNFATIAGLWNNYVSAHLCKEGENGAEILPCLGAQDVANMMILMKLGRIMSGTTTADSYVDIAGYAACGCEIATTQADWFQEVTRED